MRTTHADEVFGRATRFEELVCYNSGMETNRRLAFLALCVSVPIPVLGTLLAMVWFPEAVWAKVLFFGAKVWMLAVPVWWLEKVQGVGLGALRVPRWSGFPGGPGMAVAHGTGLAIAGVILGAYYGFAWRWVDFASMQERVAAMSLDRPTLYLLGALYWCTVNSLLEEYFWRWFTFSRLRDVLPEGAAMTATAVVLAGLLFTVHHVVALGVYFDWRITLLGSAGVAVGGVVWSAIYSRYGNIYAPYVSHVYADLAIFWIGWRLIFAGG